MNRLQKKCLVISLAMHGLLLLVLVVGPAFLPARRPAADDLAVLDFIPATLVDAAFSGGGNPAPPPLGNNQEPRPPARAVQPPPRRASPPAVREEPATPPERVKAPKTTEINEESLDLQESPRRTKPKRSILEELKTVTRPNHQERPTPRETQRDRDRRAQEEAREAAAAERNEFLNRALSSLKGGLSGSTSIRAVAGGTGVGGTGGPAYARYDQAIKTIYERAWYTPRGLENVALDSLHAWVRIVVARSGEITHARIETPSGNAAFDLSVRQALDRVKSLPAFPEASKDEQRTYEIEFKPEPNAKQPWG